MTGSVMFEMDVEGQKVLYTGDFSPRDRFRIKGARPVKVDVLLTEATFGKPQYVFPPTDRIFKVMTDWIEDSLSQGFSVALFTSSNLGKTHELIHALRDLEPRVHGTISESSRVLQRCGLDLEIREHESRGCQLTVRPHRGARQWHDRGDHDGEPQGATVPQGERERLGGEREQAGICGRAVRHLGPCRSRRAPRLREGLLAPHGVCGAWIRLGTGGGDQQKLGIDACPVPSAGQQCLLNY